ncbi:hypothetical protein [Virgibacillus sp. 6R]|uniref:hypothetical protein n=1 Tax=Virgibacillus sp. 6R TaxID=1911587 RepID=UPI0012EBA1A4|nr:hypothetical protein [Virgibacillus sp. 6R]MBS7427817.1 hypothetical protein [Virgibacillus sp. 19R1-5]
MAGRDGETRYAHRIKYTSTIILRLQFRYYMLDDKEIKEFAKLQTKNVFRIGKALTAVLFSSELGIVTIQVWWVKVHCVGTHQPRRKVLVVRKGLKEASIKTLA